MSLSLLETRGADHDIQERRDICGGRTRAQHLIQGSVRERRTTSPKVQPETVSPVKRLTGLVELFAGGTHV